MGCAPCCAPVPHLSVPLLTAAALLLCAVPSAAELRLPSLVADHMVLQRGLRVPVWGWASPGARVTVAIAGQTHTGAAAADGRWRVLLRPVGAGGPYEMRIAADGSTTTVHDVMVGDVWVASGQSNMVWPLSEARDGAAEVAAADHPDIRLFALRREAAASPQPDCHGQWARCTPASAGGFSAVAYFFGRALQKQLGVPIGLIQTDVGGTPAESWCAPEWLRGDPAMADLLAKVPPAGASARVGQADYERTMNEWYLRVLMKDPGNRGAREGWQAPSAPLGEWRPMRLPGAWETNEPSLQIDGAVWFRRTVTVPASWAGRDLVLDLGTIADHDVTYFDGAPVGETVGPMPLAGVRRTYRIPGRLVKGGEAVIAVRVWNQIAAGGFTGQPADMRLQPVGDPAQGIALAGEWLFRVEVSRDAASVPPMPAPPTDAWTAWSTGGLYNAMVAPLTLYGIRGVIWYQGESNVGRAAQYRKLFPAMIQGWRRAWSQGAFPFLFVQLANFQPRKPQPGESDWADLRDAQTAALSLPRTGMAVAIDVGDAADIHPKNKLAVGERLALTARAVAYGDRRAAASGPVFGSMAVRGGTVTLRFRHTEGGLAAAGNRPLAGFALAGADGRYVWAHAAIVGQTVVLSHPLVPHPVAVRYAWADNPECNLVNGAGLPAAPFQARRRQAAGGAAAAR